MAIIKNPVLGEISGKMGNTVSRKMNGKLFISLRPTKYKKQRKKIPARLKMRTVVPFCAAINNIEELNKIWAKCDIKARNSYQKMIKHALKNTETEKLSINNKITPGGIKIYPTKFELNDKAVFIDISNNTKEINSLVKNNFTAYLLFYLYDPLQKKTDSTSLFLIKKKFEGISDNSSINLEITMRKNYKSNIDKYGKCLVYAAFISFNIKTNKFSYSDTFAKTFNLTG